MVYNAEICGIKVNKKKTRRMISQELFKPLEELKDCSICPRECHVNRWESGSGTCRSDASFNIASICIHNGEEPAISGPNGICNIFFTNCNLQCVYCQNHQISDVNLPRASSAMELDDIVRQVTSILDRGIKMVGFVSPSHLVPQAKAIIRGVHDRGIRPTIIYNTNSYDKVGTLRSIGDLIDVYIPDYKYVTADLAKKYSDTYDYPVVALQALKEIYFQKGSSLRTDDNGRAENGMLIRHLVLPGHTEESRKVLHSIADELSTGVHLSLMSQYHPTELVRNDKILNRALYRSEYEFVVETMYELGFRNGYIQEMDSNENYRPDFSKGNPFE